jgi:hypothetical protein
MTTPRRLPLPVPDERAHLFSVGEAPGHEGDGGPGDQALGVLEEPFALQRMPTGRLRVLLRQSGQAGRRCDVC